MANRHLPEEHPVVARDGRGRPVRNVTDILPGLASGQGLGPPIHPEALPLAKPPAVADPKNLPRRRRPRPAPAPQGLIPWPQNASGALVGGPWPAPPVSAPAPESLGSADWWATASVGSSEEAIRLLESLISGQGAKAPQQWIRVARLWREWQRQLVIGELDREPTLNQVLEALAIPTPTLISYLQSGITALAVAQSQVRLALGLPKVVSAAVASATDIENGFQDRRLLFDASGLTTKGGPAVVINNSNQQTVAPVATAPAVLQNLANMIDADVREAEAIDVEVEDV